MLQMNMIISHLQSMIIRHQLIVQTMKKIEIVIPLTTTIPCGMSLICLISLMAYILIKPLSGKKKDYVKL